MRKVKTRIKTDRFHGDGREGGSLLYVIFFITLLSVFACGFMAVSRYHIKMALKNRAYMEARLTTVSYRITCNNGNQRTLINP